MRKTQLAFETLKMEEENRGKQAKECRWPLKYIKVKETDHTQSLHDRMQLTLILAHRALLDFQLTELKPVNLCCFTTSILLYFVKAIVEKLTYKLR